MPFDRGSCVKLESPRMQVDGLPAACRQVLWRRGGGLGLVPLFWVAVKELNSDFQNRDA